MDIDSSIPSPPHLDSPSSSETHTKLSIDASADVNGMKIANPPNRSVPPAVVVQTPKPQTPSLQADDATLIEAKSSLRTHAYSRAKVIISGTYSRSSLRSAKG